MYFFMRPESSIPRVAIRFDYASCSSAHRGFAINHHSSVEHSSRLMKTMCSVVYYKCLLVTWLSGRAPQESDDFVFQRFGPHSLRQRCGGASLNWL